MRQVTVTELKNQLSRYLRLVKRGETLEVVERSVPIARIEAIAVEASRNDEHLSRLVREGVTSHAKRRPPRDLGPPVPCRGDAVLALVEERGER